MLRQSNTRRGSAICVAVALVSALAVPALAETGSAVTVGDFLVSVAGSLGIDAANGAQAEAVIRESGYDLPEITLDGTLTEGDMASIATAFGLPVTTSRPAAPVSGQQVDSFLLTFGQDLGGEGDAETRSQPNPGTDKGKGKKKGHFKSPKDPF